MIRTVLCAALSAVTLVLALATSVVQATNHARGQQLDQLKEECCMLEAVNGDRAERILAHDHGPIDRPAPAGPAKAAEAAP